MYIGKVYVTNYNEVKNKVISEMHNITYAKHPRYHKIIAVVRSQYFWLGTKKEVDNYIEKCLECHKVKTEHKHSMKLLQPLPIPQCMWEVVIVYFITKIHRMMKQHDSLMVVVHKLTKVTHFIPVSTIDKVTNIVEIYMNEVVRLHGMPKETCLDRDPKFTSNVWKGLFKGLRKNLNLTATY
jgi:hypothetical protein